MSPRLRVLTIITRLELGGAQRVALHTASHLDREFFIQEAQPRENLDWARLIPKTQDTEFLRIELGLKGNEVRRMELYDQFGQTTIIRFEGVMRGNQ